MTEARYFSDEVLTAYIDGEADQSTRNAIETALRTDAVLAERLASLEIPIGGVSRAFDGLLDIAPGIPELPATSHDAVGKRNRGIVLAASLVVGLVFGAGIMSWRTPQPPGWMDYVAAYHALYVNETLADVVPDTDTSAITLSALSATLGYELSQADQDGLLEFRRGQILGYQGRPLVQLAYLSSTGDPVALCIIRSQTTGSTSEISVSRLEGMAAAHWEKNGFEFLLIGGTDQTVITDAAQQLAGWL